ncbi:MAG: hypothetical protein ACLTOV_01570 [Phocaeicola sp.]
MKKIYPFRSAAYNLRWVTANAQKLALVDKRQIHHATHSGIPPTSNPSSMMDLFPLEPAKPD